MLLCAKILTLRKILCKRSICLMSFKSKYLQDVMETVESATPVKKNFTRL